MIFSNWTELYIHHHSPVLENIITQLRLLDPILLNLSL